MVLNTEKIVKIEFLLSIGIVVFTLLNYSGLVSLCFYTSFIILAFEAIIMIQHNNNLSIFSLSILIIAFLCVLLNMISRETHLNLGNSVFYLVFAALIIYIYMMLKVKVTFNLYMWIINCGCITALIYPLAYYGLGIRTVHQRYLTMNFSNSNLLGMWILQSVMFCIVGMTYYNSIRLKILFSVAFVLNIILMYQSGSRNAILALSLGGILLIIISLKEMAVPKWLIVFVDVAPLIFVWFYLKAHSWISSSYFLGILEMEEKGIDSRYDIWKSTLYNIKDHVWTGDYFRLAGNVHNSHLTIICSFGIIVLFMTLIFLYKVMNEVNKVSITFRQKLCLICFFVTIFMGIGEGALFSGGLGLYIPSCSFIVLARYSEKTA